MTEELPEVRAKGDDRVSRLPILLALVGLALVLFWIGLSAIRVADAGRRLLARQDQANELMNDGVMYADPAALEQFIEDTRGDVVELNAALQPYLTLAPKLSWLPKIGPTLAASPELMAMAVSGSDAAYYAYRGLKPALEVIQEDGGPSMSSLPRLLTLFAQAEPDLARANVAVEQLADARGRIANIEALPWRVRSLLETTDRYLPAVRGGLSVSLVLPELMGIDGPRNYLILAQNEDELRPTGGFISGAGLLVVNGGRIESIAFENASDLDDWVNKPYDFPPRPLYEFMGMDIFLLRDANFWPDFPRSAEQAMALYTYGQDVAVDGVIAIDQHFLERLLSAVGPVFVAELSRNVNAGNVVDEMRAAWGPEDGQANWVKERKAFMGPLASALMRQLEDSLDKINLVNLALIIQNAIEERHLQISVPDPSIAVALAEAGWDGGQANVSGHDFLLTVDTNMGFNKVNEIIERKLSYRVSLEEDGGGVGQLTVHYRHHGDEQVEPCTHGTQYTQETRYADLINDCYWNYLRVYVPEEYKLLQSSRHPVSADFLLSQMAWDGHARRTDDESVQLTAFDNFFLLEQGKELSAEFMYQLPQGVSRSTEEGRLYELLVKKQAGTLADSLEVVVTLPPGTSLVSATPQPAAVNGSDLSFITTLNTDKVIRVLYR